VSAKCLGVALGSLLQVQVAAEAARVVHILFPALADSVPVDVIGLLEQFHGRIDHAVKAFHPEVMQRVVMGYVALGAGGAPAGWITAAVNIFAVGSADGGMRVTTAAEFIVTGCLDHGVQAI